MGMKKGIFFTIDSLLASGIVIVSILLFTNLYVSEQDNVNVNYASQDLVRVFSYLKVSEINNAVVDNLTSSGDITKLNITILEQIGEFWAEGNTELARNFTESIIEKIIPKNFGFSVLIDDEDIYTRNLTLTRSLISSRKLISGIAKDKPIEGFTSRAFLNSIKEKKYTSYAYLGGFVGQGNITVFIDNIPSGVTILDMGIELDSGGQFNLFINEVQCQAAYIPGSGTMTADYWNITSCAGSIIPGAQNNFSINFVDDVGSSYIGGGSIKVTYLTDEFQLADNDNITIQYFPEIKGIINLFSSFYVPGILEKMNINLHYFAQTSNITNTLYLTIGNKTILRIENASLEGNITLNDANITPYFDYADLSETTVPIRVGFENVSFISTFEGNADVGLITDISGSMDWRMDNNNAGTLRNCDDSSFNDSGTRRISVAKCLDKQFAEDIINISGNKVGLIAFESTTEAGSLVNPTSNISLINETIGISVPESGYNAGGGTCICCGINSAVSVLIGGAVTQTHIAKSSSWNYNNNYLLSSPPADGEGDEWNQLNYDDSSWAKGSAILGATNDFIYAPYVVTELGTNFGINITYADLWEHGDDTNGAPNDFSSGILNYTANTFGISAGDDGWDFDTQDNSGPFGFDDNIDYNEIVSKELQFDNNIGGSNTCSSYDCSAAYGIEVAITPEMYNLVSGGGTVTVSFYYGWDGNDNPFESSDEVWIKAIWDSPTTGQHYLGSEQSSSGGDTTFEIDREDNPDTEFSGMHTQEITQWIEGSGQYYLTIGGKLLASASDEYGTWYFDNIQIKIEGIDLNSYYADFWEHGDDTPGPPLDFSSGILNYTVNTYGFGNGDDGWDFDTQDNSGPFGFDDNIDYNEVSNGVLELDNDIGGSDNTCSSRDCSGAYGIEVNITKEMYDVLQAAGSAVLSFDYEWDGNDNPFESSDQVWIKSRWTSSVSGANYLGSNLDSGHSGSDTDLEVATADNPDSDFTGTFSQDISNWIEAEGMYYLELGGKLRASASNEYGWFRFDNLKLRISNITNHYYFRKNFSISDISQVKKGILNVLSDDYAKVYLNGVLVDADPASHNAEEWNRRGISVDGSIFQSGTNILAVDILNSDMASKFDIELLSINDSRDKAMMVMTDGQATSGAPCPQSGTPEEQAIEAACDAREDYGITVYAVGYSDSADEATLEAIADCGEGIFEKSDNTSSLLEFYQDVAASIVSASRHSQTIEIEGSLAESILYGDSFLNFTYTPTISLPEFDEIALSFEEKNFKNCTFNISLFKDLRITEAKLTSYSSEHWTDYVRVNNLEVYNLSKYNSDYTILGDPFIVDVPPQILAWGNNSFYMRTGDIPENSTGCSLNNTLIYTGMLKSSVSYSAVLESADGCSWTIETEDSGFISADVPKSYSGPNTCSFSNAQISYNTSDSIDVAVFQLLSNLDFDDNGKININIEEADLDIQSIFVGNVPSLWGPAVVEIRIWE
jgi:hypothetical protein